MATELSAPTFALNAGLHLMSTVLGRHQQYWATPQDRYHCEMGITEMVQIFPWSALLETGIEDIDQQHQRQVELLNPLADHYVKGEHQEYTPAIIDELADYARYHFTTEEGIWRKHFPAASAQAHELSHHRFSERIRKLGHQALQTPRAQEELLGFLTEWLAFHILDSDLTLAWVVLGLKQGMTIEQAEWAAQQRKQSRDERLASTIMTLYRRMTTQTLQLMREREAHLRGMHEQHQREEAWLREDLLQAQRIGQIGSWKLDVATGAVDWSPETCRIVGRNPDHGVLTEDDYWDAIHPADRDRVRAAWEASKQGHPYEVEHRVVRDDGVVWVRSRGEFDNELLRGRHIAIGTVEDISDERRLKEHELRLQAFYTAVQHLAEGLIFADLDGRVRFTNPAWANMHGHLAESLPGHSVRLFHTAQQYRDEVEPLMEELRQQGHVERRIGHVRSDGSEFPARLSLSVVRDDDGEPISLIGIGRDISRQVSREKQYRFKQQFNSLVADASTSLLGAIEDDELNQAINQTLSSLGELFQVDRMFLFQVSESGELWSNTHEWCAEGIEPQMDWLQDVHLSETPWWVEQLEKQRPLIIDDVAALPEEAVAERELLQSQGVQSLLCLPTRDTDQRMTGFIGLDLVRRQQSWSEELARMLQVIADMVASTLIRKAINQSLLQSRADLINAQRTARIGTWKQDFITGKVSWSGATSEFFDLQDLENLTAGNVMRLVYPEDRGRVQAAWHAALKGAPFDVEHRTARRNGEVWLRVSAEFQFDDQGNAIAALGTTQDITEKKHQEQQLEALAFKDALTGLDNRHGFEQRLQKHLDELADDDVTCLFQIDLDELGRINSDMGMSAGDIILQTLGDRLLHFAGERGIACRLGGDQFVVALFDQQGHRVISDEVNRIRELVSQPIRVDGDRLHVTASIGTVFAHHSEVSQTGALLRMADNAIYRAKLGGKDQHANFDVFRYLTARSRQNLLVEIRHALRENQFRLYYQPKVNLLTGELFGLEGLIRWQHPERGLLGPGDIIPLIEYHPLMVDVGDWVIRHGLEQLRRWREQGHDLALSLNVAHSQLEHPDFIGRLSQHLASLPDQAPEKLELEILERSPSIDLAQAEVQFQRIKAMGVLLSLDDFGTGHSSLQSLHRLAPDIIKIDQSFVFNMLKDPSSHAIVRAIIDLSLTFQLTVVAEGVETAEHARELTALGCSLAQGYLIAKPMPADEVIDWLDTWNNHLPDWIHTASGENT